MTIHDLKTGNIVVNREGTLGVVINEFYIIYQNHDRDWMEDFLEDLSYFDEDKAEYDIMEVYEEGSFSDYMVNKRLWQRDEDWQRPIKTERKMTIEETKAKIKAMKTARLEENATLNKCISVMAQQFYGNRTGTEVNRDEVDYFLRGCLSREVYKFEDLSDMDRRIVHVPGAEHIVIVYDQTQENEYINVEFPETYKRLSAWYREGTGREMTMPISCEIPEIDFEIHTRCIACRIDKNGVLQSLENDDYKKFIHYFPER